MNYVEPIKDLDTLNNMCRYLKETNERNYIMFVLGIYTGLRVSDILSFKVKDLRGKKHINIREKKTGKQKMLPINSFLRRELEWYLDDKHPEDFIIKSRKGYNKAISRVQAYNILDSLGKDFGIYDLGTHSMRKTFGYHYYKQTKNIGLLMTIFNHSTPDITLRYIGIAQEDVNKAYMDFRYS